MHYVELNRIALDLLEIWCKPFEPTPKPAHKARGIVAYDRVITRRGIFSRLTIHYSKPAQ
jgi:hypothetical protein